MKNFALPLMLVLAGCFQPVPGLPTPDAATAAGAGDGGTTPYCDAYAAAFCAQSVRCGETMGLFLDRCLTAEKGRCTQASREQGYQLPEPVKAQACLTGLLGACRRQGITYDCDHVFEGRVPESGACLVPADCADPMQSCGGPDCAKTCRHAGDLGEPCLQDERCSQPFVCDRKTVTCTRRDPPGEVGGSCGNFYPKQCEPNATCDYQTSRCVALPVAGQQCSFTQERCAASASCKGNACQARLDADAACSSTEDCVTGLFCDGTCKWRAPGGSPCQRNEECYDALACVTGECAVPLAPGQACTASSECDLGLACDAVTRVCSGYTLQTRVASPCTEDLTICLSPLRCVGALKSSGTIGACQAPPVCPCAATQQCEPTSSGGFTCKGLALENAVCNHATDCQPPLSCVATSSGMRCGKLPALGEACRVTKANPSPCMFPLNCLDGTCVEAGASGEACLGWSGCISGGCDPITFLCGPGFADKAACTAHAACASNTCLRGKCTSTCGG